MFWTRPYTEIPVPLVGDLQMMGDLTFLPNGTAILGNRSVPYGEPLLDYPFGGGFVARRAIGQPKLLEIVGPGGEIYTFRYSRAWQTWFRRVPKSPRTMRLHYQQSLHFGPVLGTLAWLATTLQRPLLIAGWIALVLFLIVVVWVSCNAYNALFFSHPVAYLLLTKASWTNESERETLER